VATTQREVFKLYHKWAIGCLRLAGDIDAMIKSASIATLRKLKYLFDNVGLRPVQLASRVNQISACPFLVTALSVHLEVLT
jgi:dissimilatory sulfite reductase (desulfoviridin) alpha/beta subunit